MVDTFELVQNILKKLLVLSILLLVFGCTASPMPPEVKLAEEQEHKLWSSGAQVYAPEEYNRYRISFRQAKENLIKEKSRFFWFQDYQTVQSEVQRCFESRLTYYRKRYYEQKNKKRESTCQSNILP